MLLFKPEHVPMILEGSKTQTRRLWPHGCRVKVGNIYQARTKMLDPKSTFALLRVKRVWQEPLEGISFDDAWAEGYASKTIYLDTFHAINKTKFGFNPTIWAVEFEVERA